MRFWRMPFPALLALAAAAAAVLPCAALAATTGSLAGIVVDDETGEALPGVNLSLAGTALTTVSDASGAFAFLNLPPGDYSVSAALIGYAPAEVTGVDVQMDLVSRITIRMRRTVEEEEPEVVVVQNRLLTNPDATQTLYTRSSRDQQLARTSPHAFNQVPDIVSTVPGVVQDGLGNLHIRGGRDDEIGWMIEGIPVTNPVDNTFGTNLVNVGMSRLQVYTGGYQAEYGNAISGILNEIKKTGSEVMGGSLEVTAGARQFLGALGEAGGVLPSGLDWYVANYTWRSDFSGYIARAADSEDTTVKLVFPAGPADRLTLLWTTGFARYLIPPVEGAVPDGQDQTTQGYGLAGLTWSRNLPGDANLLIRPYYLMSKNRINALATELGDSAISRSLQRGVQAEFRKALGGRHALAAGVWYIRGSNSFRRYIPDLALRLSGDPDIASMFDPFDYTSRVGTRQLAVFAQDKIRISDEWVVDAGLRYDRMRYDKTVGPDFSDSQLSPRVGVAWSRDPRTVVRASWGRFIQFIPTSVLDRVYTNPAWEMIYASDAILDPERATSWEVSLERQVRPDTVLRITPFYREYSDLLDRVPLDPDDPGSPLTFVSRAKATARGLEFSIARRMGAGLRGWLSYTWSRVRVPSAFDPSAWTYPDWDQRHTLDATVVRGFGLTEASARIQWGSGLPWTAAADTVENTRRVKDNFVVTLGLSRPLTSDPSSGRVGIHVYNVFDSRTPTTLEPDGSVSTQVLPRAITVSFSRSW